jgi:polysaccharide export outer membrane protein
VNAQDPQANGQTQEQTTTSAGRENERYRIGFQDTLDVQVFRHPELARRVTVNPNGTINLFRLDEPILAVCKTETELANDIAKAYEKDYLRNPEVNVIAIERKSQAVAVIGAVEKPGSFYIDRRVHLLELLAFAGGPKTDAVGSRLIVARTGSTSNCRMNEKPSADGEDIVLMDFKIRDIQEGKQTLWMKPGDIVSVLDADQVFVYGNVNKQGAVKMSEPLTLTQAIVSAEGFKPATQMDNVRVLRRKPGSTEPEEIVYNFKEIAKGTKPDPFLEPNDIVAVSQDKTKAILKGIGKSLTNGLSTIFYKVP